jgi:lipopolysaccharide transport system permease protein
MRTVVRTHQPALARPIDFLRGVGYDLRRSLPLALELAKRDVRKQYRQSLFGPAVVVLSPLVMTAAALGFRRSGILNVDSAGTPYALFVFAGAILWITFLETLNAPIFSLLAEQRLLSLTSAPAEAILLGKLGALLLNLAIRSLLLVMAIAWYRVSIPATVVLAPLGVLSLAALGTSAGLLIAPVNLLYRDTSWMLATATTLWFFFSPVYFPAPSGGAIGAIMRVNPVTPLLSDTRALILTGNIPHPLRSFMVMAGACLLLVLCWLYARIVLAVAIEQVSE